MSDQPAISIIIVSWNVRPLLLRCLASIERYVSYPHQVIVVDNASTDGSVAAIRKQWPAVEVIANATNRGFAAANNLGWFRARGQYLVFLNPDTELISEPFRLLIDYLERHPTVGCLGPEILSPDRHHQQSVRNFPRWSDQAITLLKLRHLLSASRPMRRYLADPGSGRKKPMAVDQIMGAAMVMPRAVFGRLQGFDERYWIWFEEVDLCQRLRRLGYEVMYHPGSQIVHHGRQSFGQVLSLKKHLWFLRSLYRYVRKFWPAMAAWSLVPLLGVSYLLTLIQTLFKPR